MLPTHNLPALAELYTYRTFSRYLIPCGAIKSIFQNREGRLLNAFQFHTGTIKSIFTKVSLACI